MLRRIRTARIDFKTGVILLALALIVWALFAWARIVDFVPEEFRQPAEAPVQTP